MNKEKVIAWIESLEDMAEQSDRYFVERTELYKENKELKEINEEHQKLNGELREENKEQEEYIKYWQNEYDKKVEVIDKAIEYINSDFCQLSWETKQRLITDNLLEILKGSDK